MGSGNHLADQADKEREDKSKCKNCRADSWEEVKIKGKWYMECKRCGAKWRIN